MYYIAGPLFNKEQINVIKSIEKLLDQQQNKYFSPREYGVIVGESMTPERMKRIFDMNIDMLDKCDVLIAIIDDRDIGTIFEMGAAFMSGKKIITYSSQGHGVNVMLKHAIVGHTNDLGELMDAFNGHYINDLEVTS